MNRLFRLLGLGVALLAAPVIASAAVLNFTVNGTANQATNGYTLNQAVSFTFTLKSFGPATPVGLATIGSDYRWDEDLRTDPELFASISGTGLSGSWTRPVTIDDSPSSYIYAFASGRLYLQAGTNSSNDTGLMVNAQGFGVLYISAIFDGLGVLFNPITGTLPDPTVYFGTNLIGTYTVTGPQLDSALYLGGVGTNFSIASLTISAVPEPSSYAAIAGAVALGGVLVRRRRRA